MFVPRLHADLLSGINHLEMSKLSFSQLSMIHFHKRLYVYKENGLFLVDFYEKMINMMMLHIKKSTKNS